MRISKSFLEEICGDVGWEFDEKKIKRRGSVGLFKTVLSYIPFLVIEVYGPCSEESEDKSNHFGSRFLIQGGYGVGYQEEKKKGIGIPFGEYGINIRLEKTFKS